MKTVGIIGGMGPEATTLLQEKIINGFKQLGLTNRPDILVALIPVGLDDETKLITNTDTDNFVKLLCQAARRLQLAGADFLIIACNTVHTFINDIRGSVQIPVISVLEETKKLLIQKGIKKTAILATTFTIENKLFDNDGFTLIKPNINTQKKIASIFDELAKGHKLDLKNLQGISDQLQEWVDLNINVCLLACSETQLLTDLWSIFRNKIMFIDTMEILAKQTIINLIKI